MNALSAELRATADEIWEPQRMTTAAIVRVPQYRPTRAGGSVRVGGFS
jgi:hypothetical protein